MWIQEIFDDEGLLELEAEWRALVDRAPEASPFQSWEWAFSWWKHLGRGRLWVLAARLEGQLVAILPLCISRFRGLPFRQVRFVGAPQADVQDPIALAAVEERCAEAFCDHLLRSAHRWDFLDLADVRMAQPLIERLRQDDFHGVVAPHRVLPYVPLPESWDAFTATLDKGFRKKIAYERRRVARDFQVAFETVRGAEVGPTMEALFELHTARWRQRWVAGAFADPRVRDFHRELARRFDERGRLRLHRVVIDGRIRAVLYAFQQGARVSYYLSGFDPAFGKYGLGNLSVAYAIEQAIGERARELDFLRGNEPYKYQWKPVERRTVRCVMGTPATRSLLARLCNRVERRIERAGLTAQERLWHAKPA